MGGGQGKNLVQDYSKKKGTLTASKDDRAIRRIFAFYDKNKDGKLDKEESLVYIKDVLEVTGVSKAIWEDAVVTDDPKQYFNELIAGFFEELRNKKNDYLEVDDLMKLAGFDRQKLQDLLSDISERLEESYQEQLFHKALMDDIDELREAYNSHELIKDIKYDDKQRKIKFPIKDSGVRAVFNIHLPKDFPVGNLKCTITFSEDDVDLEQEGKINYIEKVVSKACKGSNVTIASVLESFVDAFSKEFHEKSKAVAKPKVEVKNTAWRTQSRDASKIRDVKITIANDLEKDAKEAQFLFGKSKVSYLDSANSVRLVFDAKLLDPLTAQALGVTKPDEEVAIISLTFDSLYTNVLYPPSLTSVRAKSKGAAAATAAGGAPATGAVVSAANLNFSDVVATVARNFINVRWPTLHRPANWVLNQLLEQTKGKYTWQQCMAALVDAQLDYDYALDILKGDRDPPPYKGEIAENYSKPDGLSWCLKKGYRQLAVASALYQKRFRVDDTCHILFDLGCDFDDVDLLKEIEGRFDDRVGANKNNIILELTSYIVHRLKHFRGFCLLCGARIDALTEVDDDSAQPAAAAAPADPNAPAPVLLNARGRPMNNRNRVAGNVSLGGSTTNKLVICTKGTCQFLYIEMKTLVDVPIELLPQSISSDIFDNSEIADLYISLFYAAASPSSSYREKVCSPFPPYLTGHDKWNKVMSVLNDVPTVDDMLQHCKTEKELRKYLGGDVYLLLHWLLSTQRGVLLKLPKKRQISVFHTEHQYLMQAGTDPERRLKFADHRDKYGTYFAFHGSNICNWHAILHNGLKNLSGTDLQRNGAAYGSGVYMAADAGTSFGYSSFGTTWPKSKFGKAVFGSSSLLCLSIAEVAKGPGVPTKPNPYYVVAADEYIMTRFFLFWANNSSYSGGQVRAQELGLDQYFDEIKNAQPGEPGDEGMY